MSNHSETRCSQRHKYLGPVEKSSTKNRNNRDVVIDSVCSCSEYFDLILGYKLVSLTLTSKNLKILIGKFFYYCLKFCQIMPQKSSLQTVLKAFNDKGFGFVVNM